MAIEKTAEIIANYKDDLPIVVFMKSIPECKLL